MITIVTSVLIGCIDPKFQLGESVHIPSMHCDGTVVQIEKDPPCRYRVNYSFDYIIGESVFDQNQLVHKSKDE